MYSPCSPPVLFLAFDGTVCSSPDKWLLPTGRHHSFCSSQSHSSSSPKCVLTYAAFWKNIPKVGYEILLELDTKMKCLALLMDAPQIQLCTFVFLPSAILSFYIKYPLISLYNWLILQSPLRFKSSVTSSRMSSLTYPHVPIQ